MISKQMAILLLGFSLVSTPSPLKADSTCNSGNEVNCLETHRVHLSVAVGLGVRSNPLEGGSDIPLVLLPQISYYRDRFFINNLDLGFTLLETDRLMVNAVASPGYDRVYFLRNDPQNYIVNVRAVARPTMGSSHGEQSPIAEEEAQLEARQAKPRFTYLGGVEISGDWGAGHYQLLWGRDLLGRHQGDELRFALQWPLLQRAWTLSGAVGGTWKSAELVNYYYGSVHGPELDSTLNPFMRITANHRFNASWDLLVTGQYEWIGTGMRDSLLLDEDVSYSVFVGGLYRF